LALAQTASVVAALGRRWPAARFDTVPLETSGDRQRAGPADFTDALDSALVEGRLEFAVHSAKDLPVRLDRRLALVACPRRIDPRDALVGVAVTPRRGPPRGARIGSSSPRRRAQLLRWRPDLRVVELRGNVDSRLLRVERGEIDAAILAVAGLERLGLADSIRMVLPPERFLPAPGQGALALVARAGDRRTAALLRAVDHSATRRAVLAERAVASPLGGDCEAPLGVLAVERAGRLTLTADALSEDGRQRMRASTEGRASAGGALAHRLARRLLRAGVRALWAT
jgi:hydroxymethylbilane synthase